VALYSVTIAGPENFFPDASELLPTILARCALPANVTLTELSRESASCFPAPDAIFGATVLIHARRRTVTISTGLPTRLYPYIR
jgi:hypothetical protein